MDSQTLKEPRIVSLLPSATEIVALVGCLDRLVGVSHECDYPESVRALPRLTSSRLIDPGSSRGIDMDVRRLVSDALSICSVDAEGLRAVGPSVIVTQDLCEVCAVSIDDVRAAVARIADRDNIELVTLSPTRIAHVMDDIKKVARALGVPEQGEIQVKVLLGRIDDIRSRAAKAKTRPRVVSVEWMDPIMLGGTWMPEMIEIAGGTAMGADPGAAAPTVTLKELAALDPEVLLLKPCGFSIERTLQETALVEKLCAAVGENTRVLIADGNAYFNRSGPRLVESLEILAACTHPELFADFESRHQAGFVPYKSAGRN